MIEETRDVATRALTLVEQHMLDCGKYREIMARQASEFRDDIKKLNRQMAYILGGLILLGHASDMVFKLFHL